MTVEEAQTRFQSALNSVWFIGIANLVLGIGAVFLKIDFMADAGGHWFALVSGVMFIVLGIFIRERSTVALWIAIVLFALLTLQVIPMLLDVIAPQSGRRSLDASLISGLIIRIGFLSLMFRGVGAIAALNRADLASPDSLKNSPLAQKLQGLPLPSDLALTPAAKASAPASGAASGATAPRLTPRQQLMASAGVIALAAVVILLFALIASSRDTLTNPQSLAPAATAIPLVVGEIDMVNAVQIPIGDDLSYALNLPVMPPVSPMNVADVFTDAPTVAGDLAWKKPAYAQNYYANGYPSGPTSGWTSIPWRSAGSTGTWYYVDLGTAQSIHQILIIHGVDNRLDRAPMNDYIVSDDLQTWRVVARENNRANAATWTKTRLVTLNEDVTARYVGLYALNWANGAWGGINLFAVLPREHRIDPGTLPMADAAPAD